MTKRLVVHLGLPRTGTTSIQTFLRRADAELLSLGIWYPIIDARKYVNFGAGYTDFKSKTTLFNLSRGVYHEILATALASQAPTARRQNIHVSMSAWTDFIRDFREGSCHTSIISFEGFGMVPQQHKFASISSLLQDFECEGIIYHRRYDSWVKSLLEHTIRGKGRFKLDIDDFLDRQHIKLHPFTKRIALIKQNLLLDKVTVRSFEEAAKRDALVEDFFASLGLHEAWARLAPANRPRANAGLSPSQTLVLYQLNRWGVADDAFVQVRQAFAQARTRDPSKDPYSIIPAASLARLRAMAAAEAESLHAQFGIVPAPAPEPAAPLPHRLGRERFREMIESVADAIGPETREELLRRSAELDP